MNNRRALLGITGGILFVALTLATPTESFSQETDEDGRPLIEEKVIPSAYYSLRATYYRGKVYRWQYGGGISLLDEGYILVTREGLIYHFWWDDVDALNFRQLVHRVPLNTEDFVAAAGDGVTQMWFRVADVHTQHLSDEVRVFVTHHHWRSAEKCSVLRVSVLSGTIDALLDDGTALPWRTVYETSPCLPIGVDNKGNPFAGNLVGGRMILHDENTLLVTIGDHGFDGLENTPAMPQDVDADYGKTMLIDIDTGAATIFTLGHRVPQGLYADPDSGAIWLTEHGPQGGDELNLLEKGANYGWPDVTYGMAYGMDHWPLTEHPGEHTGYVQPFFAWVPSIGASSLTGVEKNTAFPRWRGDLLATSLRDQSIWRIRVRQSRVAYAERIPFQTRIRDILQGHDGRIVIWSDEGEIVSVRPKDTPKQSLD
jgi:hypothetical protein